MWLSTTTRRTVPLGIPGYGGGGGSAFTFAPFGGPVYLDENTLRAKPTYSAGFEQRGGGIVVWWGGVKGSSDPLLTASGQTWPSEHACRSWLDDDGFGTPYVWIGPNNINTTNPIDQRAPLQLSNVREIHMYVGAGQTLTTGTSLSNPTIRLDHTQAGTGDAWAVPVLQYHDVVITPQYEAAKIRFYATYEEGVTAPAAGAGSDWNISATPWTCQKPSGDGSTGFSNFITTHPWVFDKP